MDKLSLDLLEFEKEKRLFEREYCGFHYWQGMRTDIFQEITYLENRNAEAHTSQGRSRITAGRMKAIILDFLKDIWCYFHLKKCEILYLDQGLVGAYRKVDGQMRDVYWGYFGAEEMYRTERCYYISDSQRNPQKPGIGVGLIWMYKLPARMRSVLNQKKYTDPQEEQFIRSLCEEFNERYKSNISSDSFIQSVRYNRELYQIYEKFYALLFKKIHPKVVVLQCHYGTTLYPLYFTARKFAIPVIELQHGTTVNHRAYYYQDIDRTGKDLPDYIFTYGRFWEAQMHLPAGMKAITVGNPFLEAMKEKYKDMIPDEKTIVFYAGAYSYDGKELEKLAVEFCRRYAEEGYKIYFKIHPGETATWEKNYKLLRSCEEITIVESNITVYQMFAMAKHHVSVASTVVYEACAFPVRRYVYCMEIVNIAEIQKQMIELGVAQGVHGAEELQEQVMRQQADTDLFPADEMWQPNAAENGRKALKKIMDGMGI